MQSWKTFCLAPGCLALLAPAMLAQQPSMELVIERLNRALNSVVAEPAIREKLLAQGAEGVGGTPEALGVIVAAELPKWARLTRDANIKAD